MQQNLELEKKKKHFDNWKWSVHFQFFQCFIVDPWLSEVIFQKNGCVCEHFNSLVAVCTGAYVTEVTGQKLIGGQGSIESETTAILVKVRLPLATQIDVGSIE